MKEIAVSLQGYGDGCAVTVRNKEHGPVICRIPVAILLLFMTPRSGSGAVQMLWIAMTYNLYYAIAYPCYYTAYRSSSWR